MEASIARRFDRLDGGSVSPSRAAILAYMLTVWPLTIAQLSLNFLSPFYAQSFGLSLAFLGGVLTVGRIADVGADVAIAWASDRTRSRWGRRKPWVVGGLLLYIPATIFLFLPPGHMNSMRFILAIGFFFLSWTMAFIPYLAQGTELSEDFAVKNRINVGQSATMLCALLSAFMLPVLLIDARAAGLRHDIAVLFSGLLPHAATAFLNAAAPTGAAYYGRSMLIITVLALTPLLLTLPLYMARVHEPKAIKSHNHASPLAALRNPVFRRFTLGYTFIIGGYIGKGGLMPFVLAFALRQPDSLLFFYMLMYCSSILVTPVWSRLLSRIERRSCIVLAGLIEVAGLIMLFAIPAHSPILTGIAFIIMGLPGQTLTMVPYLVAAEASDYARLKTGRESRAIHIALCSLVTKCGSVFAGINIWIAGLVGFSPLATSQPASANLMLRAIGLGIPIVMIGAGCIGVMGFPLNRRRHAIVRQRLDRRDRALAAVPPLG